MITERKKKQIVDAVVKGIQRNADRVFDISQDTVACYVPVDTGNLKRSGVVEHTSSGAKITYRAPYSSTVEHGIEHDIPITGTQKIHINAHRRRGYTRSDGTRVSPTTVKAHDVTYKDKRLIGFRPKHGKFEYGEKIFRVIDTIKAREGQHFLHRALEEGLKYISQDVSFTLRRVGKVRR